jgi:hypothetical protein
MAMLKQIAFPKAQARLSAPVFSGTVHFAQVIFTGSAGVCSVG